MVGEELERISRGVVLPYLAIMEGITHVFLQKDMTRFIYSNIIKHVSLFTIHNITIYQ